MKSPIFIVGCERSGTTLLRVMLDNHTNIAIPYEAERFSKLVSVQDPWKYSWDKEDVISIIEEVLCVPKIAFWGINKDEVLAELGNADVYSYSDILKALYQANARKHGKKRWGDKTPVNTFELFNIIKAFPDAQFIHIVRDGRDVYLSWTKAPWAKLNLIKAAYKWKRWVMAAYRFGECLSDGQYLEIRYEDLISDPEKILRKICTFLEEPYVSELLEYDKRTDYVPGNDMTFHSLLSNKPDPSRIFNWKRVLAPIEQAHFEALAGSILLKYGYEISGKMIKRVRFYFFQQRLKDWLKHILYSLSMRAS